MAEPARRIPRPLTLVCHLLVAPGAEGRIVGHVEVVNTGDTVAITSVAELVALVERFAGAELVP